MSVASFYKTHWGNSVALWIRTYLQIRHQNLCLSIFIKSTNADVLLTHKKNVNSIKSISLYIIVYFGKITLFFSADCNYWALWKRQNFSPLKYLLVKVWVWCGCTGWVLLLWAAIQTCSTGVNGGQTALNQPVRRHGVRSLDAHARCPAAPVIKTMWTQLLLAFEV